MPIGVAPSPQGTRSSRSSVDFIRADSRVGPLVCAGGDGLRHGDDTPLARHRAAGDHLRACGSLAATGTRLVLTLAHELKRSGGRYGIATACIGGGQGIAVIIESI